MPRKRPPAKTKIQGHEAGQVLETQQVDAPPDEPTVGELLGQLPVPGQPRPNPAFATFADEQEQLADPTVLPDRPGAATPPSPPYFDPQQHPDPDQGWATSHPNEIDPALPGSTFEDVTWPLDAPVAQQVEDDYRPGDNEPPPGERPVEQDPETADQVTAALNKQRQSVYDAQRRRAGLPVKDTPKREKLGMPDAGLLGEIVPPGKVRYESRINIVDAFRYNGQLAGAPDWIDRNWAGFGDYDPVREIGEGPCLRVPSSANPGEVVLCRVGDYVCRQSVLLDNGRQPEIRVEVWAADQFERLFVGVSQANAARGVSRITGPEVNLGQGQQRQRKA